MSFIKFKRLRMLGGLLLASCAVTLSSCQIVDLMHCHSCDGDCAGHARVCEKPTVRALAHDLDALEAHIEKYGSVSIQHPSVWGQARLTRHRQDFENQMAAELSTFSATLNGSMSRSDQAYFINAMSLSAAAASKSGGSSGGSSSASASAAPAAVSTSPLDSSTADITGAFSGMSRTPATLPALTGFGALAKNGITLEPTTYVRQKANYLNCLSELRRINEGDDTADSPGYALNLVRIPVSVLPGKCTGHGYGAEVTMTLKPYLSDELLPTTFRNLVMNDLLEVIGVPLTYFLNDPDGKAYAKAKKAKWDISADSTTSSSQGKQSAPPNPEKGINPEKVQRPTEPRKKANITQAAITKALTEKPGLLQMRSVQAFMHDPYYTSRAKPVGAPAKGKESPVTQEAQLAKALVEVEKPITPPSISPSKLRRAKRPFPPSQLVDIMGEDESTLVTISAYDAFKDDPANKYWIHYPDVQGFLQEELQGAYRFLADPSHMELWMYCDQALVMAIHTRNLKKIENIRYRYADHVWAMTNRAIDEDVTVALAWAIIVESALLTDQLVQDMKEAAAAKNCSCAKTDWQPYYLPSPPAEARQAFNEYVECRWPIMVFALDPVADQQNIADTFSQRREMQLAMSLAFVNGSISAKNLTRYARRIESNMEAVLLNNTVTGFSHGNETFGWRFYPRFQTPEIEGNASVFFRDLLLGDQKKAALLNQRKLEPGQRECTAIVVMPSFVPYCTLDVSSSWFKLSNPKCKDMTCVDAIKLSARVKAIDNCADRVMDADCYRDGELERLKKKAKQLEARLPLQDMKVQVPYENTLGGFAMFNTGVTDLAPELYGWYGAPGINTNDTTTLFLIGNHFNVMSTRVVAGGNFIDPTSVELLSRQVMRVTIPKNALMIDRATGEFAQDPPSTAPQTTTANVTNLKAAFGIPDTTQPDSKKGEAILSGDVVLTKSTPPAAPPQKLFVDVHIATPYGVTSHLLIPALGKTGTQAGIVAAATNPVVNWGPNQIWISYVSKGLGIASSSNPPTVRPSDLSIQLGMPYYNVNNADLAVIIGGGGSGVSASYTIAGVSLTKNQTLALTATQRDALIAAVFDKIGPFLNKDTAGNAATVTIKSITLKQDTAVLTNITAPAGATLTVNFIAGAEEKAPAPAAAGK